jgi:hypothetical protein
MGEKKLSYHDVLLRSEDVDLLRGPHWLNDQVPFHESNVVVALLVCCCNGVVTVLCSGEYGR